MRTDFVDIRIRRVRQGCVMSLGLFLLYGQRVMQENEDLEGIRVSGRNINNIRCADDTVLLVNSEEKLQDLMDRLPEACETKSAENHYTEH